jgi:hypothetical protein
MGCGIAGLASEGDDRIRRPQIQMSDAHTRRARRLVPETDLPARYQTPWRPAFVAQALEHCRPEMTILDVGGGDAPALPTHAQPASSTYIGLDPGSSNLAKGAYDVRIIAVASEAQPRLVGGVDLLLSWNVLEHVQDMPTALARFHSYLKP